MIRDLLLQLTIPSKPAFGKHSDSAPFQTIVSGLGKLPLVMRYPAAMVLR